MITVLAYKKGDPCAAISSIPLEKLSLKDFGAKDYQIDAPIDHEIETLGGTEEEAKFGEDKNYNILKGSELLSRFDELNKAGMIKNIGSIPTRQVNMKDE